MQEIPLLPVANQTFSVNLDSGLFTVTLREANGVMAADVNIDGTDVVTGLRVCAEEPIIPYAYLQNGNLVLYTQDDALPYWDQFGTSQTLFYLTDAEMA